MTFFSSNRERRLWLWLLVVMVAIYATLGAARTLVEALRERNLLRVSFGFVLLLIVAVVVRQWLRGRRPSRSEVGVALGVAAAYLWAFARIEFPEERTHLIEYSLVAILIHMALLERQSNGRRVPAPGVVALVATALLGLLDECIQSILPNRVYDLRDVGFNALAGLMAVTARVVLARVRRRGSP